MPAESAASADWSSSDWSSADWSSAAERATAYRAHVLVGRRTPREAALSELADRLDRLRALNSESGLSTPEVDVKGTYDAAVASEVGTAFLPLSGSLDVVGLAEGMAPVLRGAAPEEAHDRFLSLAREEAVYAGKDFPKPKRARRALERELVRWGAADQHAEADQAAWLSAQRPAPASSAARPTLSSRVLTLDALESLPAPSPLVEEMLDRGDMAMLVGASGIGKSFLAIDLACAVASGTEFRGRRAAEPGRVLYVATEGRHGLRARLAAWESAWHTSVPSEQLLILPGSVNLSSRTDVEELRQVVRERQVDFVILDTLNAVAGDLEENSSTAMGQLVTAAHQIRADRPDATVLLVHHTGKNGELRGSSALFAAMDRVLKVAGDSTAFTLDMEKSKDGPTSRLGWFKLSPSSGSMVVEGLSTSLAGDTADSSSEERALGLLRSLHGSLPILRSALIKSLVEDGMNKRTAERATKQLMQQGRVILSGTDKRPYIAAPPANPLDPFDTP